MVGGRPLDGVRVLEFAQLLPGPYTGLVLASLGADVIKVEPPMGDPARMMPPYVEGSVGDAGAVFCALNRGKRSVVLDLKQREDVARYHRLAASCRVVIDGYRAGVAERLGVGFDALAAARDDLLYVTLSGYGPSGAFAQEPGHDVTYQAWQGALDPARDELPHLPVADLSGALWASVLVTSHLGTTGNHRLEASLAGSLRAPLVLDQAMALAGDAANPVRAGLPGYGIYRCGDGKALAVGALEPEFWELLCEVLDDEALYALGHPGRAPGPEAHQRTAAHFAKRDRASWVEALRDAGVPCAPVRSVEEAIADPLPLASWDPPGVASAADLEGAPALGQHQDDVFAELA